MTAITHPSQLDPQGIYTYADYLSWRFKEAVELIRGRWLKMSAPSRRHQSISWNLTFTIASHFKNHPCVAYAAPFDVRLPDKRKSHIANRDILTVVQPDICIICDLQKLDDKGCIGAPDLVVEILSPGNSTKEMRLKKDLYEENGIREYWIFDPERETVHQFHLTDAGTYSPARIYINEDTLDCVIFPDLHISLAEIFYDPLAPTMEAENPDEERL
jgi:Uma2 family endonuclease